MRDQLQHSLGDIIKKGGDTLEATYENLTGLSDGFTPFKALLDKYLPFESGNSKKQMSDLLSDNPFPIWEGNDRRVGLRFTEDSASGPARRVDLVGATVTVPPFFTCPEATYRYHHRNLNSKLRCIATTEGFAQPVFSWRVNGLQTATGGSPSPWLLPAKGSISPTVPITMDQAEDPGEPASGSGVAHIQWSAVPNASTFEQTMGELDLSNSPDNHLGHEHLTVEVTVKERFGSNDSITIPGSATLDTRDIRYENQFYVDRTKCAARFDRQLHQYNLKDIPLVFKVPEPDPPPDWMNGVRALRGIADELVKVREGNPKLGARLTDQLSRSFQIPAQVFTLFAEMPAEDVAMKSAVATKARSPAKGVAKKAGPVARKKSRRA